MYVPPQTTTVDSAVYATMGRISYAFKDSLIVSLVHVAMISIYDLTGEVHTALQ